MAEKDNASIDRRKFMRIAGASVIGGSVAGLVGCGGGDSGSASPAPAPAPAPKNEPAATAPPPEPAAAAPTPAPAAPAQAGGTAERITEDDPIAASLGYRHNAADVDLDKHPKRGEPSAANQYCKNCVLFQADEDAEWGPCSIFSGKLVNANGWCATYAPKAS